ncbi:Nif3-like dinuclear metal center hexameric protein [Leucobacter aridicollis]|uniref:Nif3-like dinuclear metal center hexameric protein n=1 Tax=Leucobacter aridicollis TaxID=283878 RepID=UPI002107E9FA|nr:Nif3-like dinuclear metal center hexameric protein [Leucobacter aridicollis]UTX51775.1 Nif3-like dinuclear metal center hexameric protein [Leucobacter aridicollis]
MTNTEPVTPTPTAPAGQTLADLRRVTNEMWPADTAESWDRVGLVTGRDAAPLRRVLLAVDAVAATVDEALAWEADALITHHPLLLRGIHTVAEDTAKGALLASLIRGGCALISAHTNADQPAGGVSDVIARRLGLVGAVPIVPHPADPEIGIGRVGKLSAPETLRAFAERVASAMPSTVSGVRVAGDPDRLVQAIALLGGAGDSLLDNPAVRGADVYLTSDLRHHPAQEALELSAVAGGPALIDVAHWASESLWLEGAAAVLATRLPGVEFRVSTLRTDPWSFSVGARPGDAPGAE